MHDLQENNGLTNIGIRCPMLVVFCGLERKGPMILQSNPRKIFELLAGALPVMAGCEGPEAEVPAESREFQITCSGQTDKLVTTDYYGAIEGMEGTPMENGHAAAAEVIMRESYSAQNTSIALATDGIPGASTGLKLSIVNAKPGGCPP
jgi:hypothetical protein